MQGTTLQSSKILLFFHRLLPVAAPATCVFSGFSLSFMDPNNKLSSSYSTISYASRCGGGRGRDIETKENAIGGGWGRRGGGGSGSDKAGELGRLIRTQCTIDENTSRERFGGRGGRGHRGGGSGRAGNDIDALGRLLTRILRHMASQLRLDMRPDGFVKVGDLLKLKLTTFANVPISSHTIDDVKEAVRNDNKQRFSLLEEGGVIWIRANQGHSVKVVQTESLLNPIIFADEFPVCVHGTYKKNLKSISEEGLKCMTRLHIHFSCGLPTDGGVISGMRRDVNVLIFLDVEKALEDGMKLYISDNKVILTEGFNGVVPRKYFLKVESWPARQIIAI